MGCVLYERSLTGSLTPREANGTLAAASCCTAMDDSIDKAIKEIVTAADGDYHHAMRVTLIEMAKLQTELGYLYALVKHGRRPAMANLSVH